MKKGSQFKPLILAYALYICNKHKKKGGKMVAFVTFIVHLCFKSMKQKK